MVYSKVVLIQFRDIFCSKVCLFQYDDFLPFISQHIDLVLQCALLSCKSTPMCVMFQLTISHYIVP